jgi:PAS domain S-box-containing protein
MTSLPPPSRPRLAALLEALLGPRLCGYVDEELYRARLVVVTSLLVAGSACIPVALALALDWRAAFAPLVGSATVILTASVWRVRRTGRLAPAALTLCVTILAIVCMNSWLIGGLENPALDWTLLVALIAPMVLRPALAAGCLLVILANVATMYAASRSGHGFLPLIDELSMAAWSHLLLTVLVGGLAWTYDRARRKALADRDTALATLQESREARLALVENVRAVVYSIDRNLHLIAGNSEFDRVSHAPGELPIAPGQPVLDCIAEAQRADMKALYARAFAGEHFVVERTIELRSASFDCELLFNPIRRTSGAIRGITVMGRDISDRKRVSAELQRLNRELAGMAHLAGKAEVATDVLHNVGNALTALNGSANLIFEQLQASKVSFIAKTVALLPEPPSELARFLTVDERGRQIRAYLGILAEHLEHEHAEMLAAMTVLNGELDRVKSTVARQQSVAQTASIVEVVSVGDVITDALQLNAASLDQARITVTTEIAAVPPFGFDRYKLVEILNSLLANSRQALEASTMVDKRIVVRAFRNEHGKCQIDVVDNGVGIAREQLGRLFSYGHTTKPHGLGFSLAGSLLAARSMGGAMRGDSDGPGKGATFTIELPFESTVANPAQERAA